MFYSLNLVFVECLCTCVFMCLFIHVCGCACMCVWRPEVAFIGRGPLLLKLRFKKNDANDAHMRVSACGFVHIRMQVPAEFRRGQWISCSWSYRQLRVTNFGARD